MTSASFWRSLRAGTATWLLLPSSAGAGLPEEDRCPAISGVPETEWAEDAAPIRLREGMVIDYQHLLALRGLLPEEVWRHRDAFFYEGMRMEIGPCHRRYPVPEFFSRATEQFAGRARVDGAGNLHGYMAGLPFPPSTIDPQTADAGIRWAWNLEHRYRGGGPHGEFRIVDLPARMGAAQTYRGQFFFYQTRHRADLSESGYAVPEAKSALWVAGGHFDEPFSARHLAWRQSRRPEAHQQYAEPDDTFVYVPTMRKVRRAASTWIDGLYMPRYRVSGDAGGGALPVGSDAIGGLYGVISPNAAESIAVTEHLRRGFVGLAMRPNAYVWRVLREREVLAPLNAMRPGYPTHPDRNYGPSGIAAGNERWDVRYAVVLQGATREPGGAFDTMTLYVDYQTQQPLYVVTKRRRLGTVDIGILVHRFSGDLRNYPKWPSGEAADVFDPVAAFFFDASDGQSGWRRESWDARSTPARPEELRRAISADFLTRGR